MRKILAITFVILSSITITFASNDGNQDSKAGEVINMDKAMFIKDVFDYTANSDVWEYKGKKPAIIDFYADWCGPCRQTAPIMKELAKEYKDQIVIYKVNVDKERELASLFNATSIPRSEERRVGKEC